MNTNLTPGDGGAGDESRRSGQREQPGPADLAELKATDALLDRLADGGATDQDRKDPLVAALAQLRASLDDPLEQDSGEEIARLMDVLGERPLYLVDDDAGQAGPEDQPIWLGADEPVQLVDLTDPRLDDTGDTEGTGNGPTAEPAQPAAVLTLPRQRTGWQRVLEQAALPAASVALLVALGSGVSAALTGNPMSPVTGVGRVVSQLPGVEGQPSTAQTVTSAQEAILLAGRAAQAHQRQRAVTLLALAQKKVSKLPPAERQRLNGQILQVKQALNARTPPAMPTPDDPGVVVAKPTTAPPKHTATPTTPVPSTTAPSTTTTTTSPSPSTTPTPSVSVAASPSTEP